MRMDEKYPLALPEGTILAGQYMIEKVLGQGGFGITYRAIDHKTNQKVAVKEFFPDTLAYREVTTVISYPGERSESYEYGKESFLQEAQTLAEFIGNENIVRIHSYFEENGTAYFVMDYIEGQSFDEYIKERGGKIGVEEAKTILIPMMDALNLVHSKGIVHRDVTPDNIYITSDSTVKLLDFGAARYSLGDKSRSLDVILKHGFAPKEQYTRRGKQGPFTDIYSLGATFYFAITGKRPPDSVERLDEDDLIPPSNLGVDITEYQEKAILQALSVQPAERFQSMTAFKKVLLNENITTNQIFFTAPEADVAPTTYQTPPVVYQEIHSVSQTSSVMAQTVQSEQSVWQKPQKIKNKKLIIGIAGALVLVVFVGSVLSGNKTKKDADAVSIDMSSAGSVSEQNNATFPATESSEPVEDTGYDVSELRIVGNTAANIKNFGIITVYEDDSFFIDDDEHSLMFNDEYLYENRKGIFSCLSYYKGMLYFLYDGKAYMRNMVQDSGETLIPELEAYGGSIQLLYVAVDYYFIYVDGALYRIAKNSGNLEEWIEISSSDRFTFDNDGWLYYIGIDPDGLSTINKVAADDFSAYYQYSLTATSGEFTDLVVDGDYIYVLQKDGLTTYLQRFYSDLVIVGDEISQDITAFVDSERQGNGYYACNLNVIDNHIFLDVYEASSDSYSLHHVTLKSNGYKSELISHRARYSSVSVFRGNCTVFYIKYDEDVDKEIVCYKSYDP